MAIGLALSGGGAKGAAHIGVLEALMEENINIEYISGTSMGSLVASLFACGYNPNEYDGYLSYIFENLGNIRKSPKLISAILSILPKFYGGDVKNSRVYLGKINDIAHSLGNYPYVACNFNVFN